MRVNESVNEYDYFEAVEADVIEFLDNNGLSDLSSDDEYYDKEGLVAFLTDVLMNDDSVTGADSGSYVMDRYKAEEYICHNLSLVQEAYEEIGGNSLLQDVNEAEYLDVRIRQYLLPKVLDAVLDDAELKKLGVKFNA